VDAGAAGTSEVTAEKAPEEVPQLIYDTMPTCTCDAAAQRLWYTDDSQFNKQWARIHVDFSVRCECSLNC